MGSQKVAVVTAETRPIAVNTTKIVLTVHLPGLASSAAVATVTERQQKPKNDARTPDTHLPTAHSNVHRSNRTRINAYATTERPLRQWQSACSMGREIETSSCPEPPPPDQTASTGPAGASAGRWPSNPQPGVHARDRRGIPRPVAWRARGGLNTPPPSPQIHLFH
jgi:hypothetical protein